MYEVNQKWLYLCYRYSKQIKNVRQFEIQQLIFNKKNIANDKIWSLKKTFWIRHLHHLPSCTQIIFCKIHLKILILMTKLIHEFSKLQINVFVLVIFIFLQLYCFVFSLKFYCLGLVSYEKNLNKHNHFSNSRIRIVDSRLYYYFSQF